MVLTLRSVEVPSNILLKKIGPRWWSKRTILEISSPLADWVVLKSSVPGHRLRIGVDVHGVCTEFWPAGGHAYLLGPV